MVEDRKRSNAQRRARRNASAARQRSGTDKSISIDLDYFAGTYGIDLLDFAEVRWNEPHGPRLVLRGRRERA